MKIKLRDMTKEQFEKWYKEVCRGEDLACENCLFNGACCNIDLGFCWVNHKDLYSNKFLRQKIEIER